VKTTVEIDDALLKAAKKAAIDDDMPLRQFIELAIRQRLSSTDTPGIYGEFSTRADLYEDPAKTLADIEAAVQEFRERQAGSRP
jgi:hypothetical protein